MDTGQVHLPMQLMHILKQTGAGSGDGAINYFTNKKPTNHKLFPKQQNTTTKSQPQTKVNK